MLAILYLIYEIYYFERFLVMVQLVVVLLVEFSPEWRDWRCFLLFCCGVQMGKTSEEDKWEELVEEVEKKGRKQASAIYWCHVQQSRVAVAL